jgi:hypothetical protein
MGIIFSILVIRLLKKEMFLFFKKGINTAFNEPHKSSCEKKLKVGTMVSTFYCYKSEKIIYCTLSSNSGHLNLTKK